MLALNMISPNDVLLFDLDGTLVQSVEFDDLLYQQSVSEVIGRHDFDTRWETYTHVTDMGLLAEICTRLEIANTHQVISDVRSVFCGKIKAHLESGAVCNPMPGAKEALTALNVAGVKFGIATGSWGDTARMKLEYAGLDVPDVLASSDDAISRTGIMQHCLRRLNVDDGSVVYFGDAPWDVKATAALGWRFIGVGAQLQDSCNVWISDFSDPRWLEAQQKLTGSG